MIEIFPCPDPHCPAPAELVERWVFRSTHGPVEHVKTRCLTGHVYTPTAESLCLAPG
jgi:hypothetical protein